LFFSYIYTIVYVNIQIHYLLRKKIPNKKGYLQPNLCQQTFHTSCQKNIRIYTYNYLAYTIFRQHMVQQNTFEYRCVVFFVYIYRSYLRIFKYITFYPKKFPTKKDTYNQTYANKHFISPVRKILEYIHTII